MRVLFAIAAALFAPASLLTAQNAVEDAAADVSAAAEAYTAAERAFVQAVNAFSDIDEKFGRESAEYRNASARLVQLEAAVLAAQNHLAAAERRLTAEQRGMSIEQQPDATAVEAQARVDALKASVAAMAAGDDPEAALQAALDETRLERLRIEYVELARRARQLRSMMENGMAQPVESYDAKAAAEIAFAALREAEVQMTLDRLRRERAAGSGRAAPTSRPATPDSDAARVNAIIRQVEAIIESFDADDNSQQMQELQRQVQEALRENAELANLQWRPAEPTTVDGQLLQAEYFRGYLDTVERYGQLASDPAAARIAGVITVVDLLADKPHDAIDALQRMASDIESDPNAAPVRRVILLQLAELHRQVGRESQAVDYLRKLVAEP